MEPTRTGKLHFGVEFVFIPSETSAHLIRKSDLLNIAEIYIYYIYDHICSIVFRNATGDMNIYDFTITIQNAHIPPMPGIRSFFFKQTFLKQKTFINKKPGVCLKIGDPYSISFFEF